MRIIDADQLLEALKTEPQYLMEAPRSCKSLLTNIISNHHKKVIEVIEQQPTAYDVDKVVEQLKALCNAEVDYYSSNDVIDREDALDIVKKGGLDES